jgi:hypothetical protein
MQGVAVRLVDAIAESNEGKLLGCDIGYDAPAELYPEAAADTKHVPRFGEIRFIFPKKTAHGPIRARK